MNTRKSSIYRCMENLFLWLIDVSRRVPNQRVFMHQVDSVNDEFIEALASCRFALKTTNLEQKAELITMISYHLEMAATIVKIWHQWSSKDGNNIRILTDKQIAFYLTETEKLFGQINGWSNSVNLQLKNTQDNPSDKKC